jgi:hypothetical protein
VAVGVDQAWQQGLALRVDVLRLRQRGRGLRLAAHRHDAAQVIERQRRKALQLAGRVQRVAVGAVDDGVGMGRQGRQDGGKQKGGAHRNLHSAARFRVYRSLRFGQPNRAQLAGASGRTGTMLASRIL